MGKTMLLRWLFEASNGQPEVVVAMTRDEAFGFTLDPTAKLLDSAPFVERWSWPVRSTIEDGRRGWTWEPELPAPPIEDWRTTDGQVHPVFHGQL